MTNITLNYYVKQEDGTWLLNAGLVGPTGAPGVNGKDGTNGKDGKNGLQLIVGNGAPTAPPPEPSDPYSYVDTTSQNENWYNWDIKNQTWGDPSGTLRGIQGIRGNTITPSSTSPKNPIIGDNWIDGKGEIWTWDGNEWSDTGLNIIGPQGKSGSNGKNGSNFTGLGIAFDPPSNPPDGSQVQVILTPQIDGNNQNPVTGTLASGAKGEKGDTGAAGASLSKITLTETPIVPGQSATISLAQFDQNGNPMPSAAFQTTVGKDAESE